MLNYFMTNREGHHHLPTEKAHGEPELKFADEENISSFKELWILILYSVKVSILFDI